MCYFGKVLLHACCVERLVRYADVTVWSVDTNIDIDMWNMLLWVMFSSHFRYRFSLLAVSNTIYILNNNLQTSLRNLKALVVHSLKCSSLLSLDHYRVIQNAILYYSIIACRIQNVFGHNGEFCRSNVTDVLVCCAALFDLLPNFKSL